MTYLPVSSKSVLSMRLAGMQGFIYLLNKISFQVLKGVSKAASLTKQITITPMGVKLRQISVTTSPSSTSSFSSNINTPPVRLVHIPRPKSKQVKYLWNWSYSLINWRTFKTGFIRGHGNLKESWKLWGFKSHLIPCLKIIKRFKKPFSLGKKKIMKKIAYRAFIIYLKQFVQKH